MRTTVPESSRARTGPSGRWWVAVVIACLGPGCALAAQDPSTLEGVPYVADPYPEQVLDFHWPEGGAASTVVFIHGGSLRESGERRDSPRYRRVCDPFVLAGIACATTDYRLAPTFQWPAMPRDVVTAVTKVRELVAERGGDPDRLFLFGHSSGCTLAAAVAADTSHLQEVGLGPANLAGVIPMGCVLDNYDAALRGVEADDIREWFSEQSGDRERFGTPENLLASIPSFFVGPHVPPTLVVVARAERFFPSILEQGARFVRRLLEDDVPADLVIVPGTHRSSIEELGRPGDPAFEAIETFIRNPGATGGR